MKKLISLVLALVLVLSLSTVAFADTVTLTPSEETELKFTKNYTTSAGEKTATYPAEVLKFTVTAAQGNPDSTMISVTDHTVAANPDNVVISVPSYNTVGKYNYTVTEVPGNTQGVSYSDVTFGVQVVVTYDPEDSTKLTSEVVFTTKEGTGKVDTIVNMYDLGTLTVDKNVEGNLASKTQKFDIDVVFTSTKPVLSDIDGVTGWTLVDGVYTSNTVTVSLADGDTVHTFANIPAGVEYTVVEQAKHLEKDDNGSDGSKGYTVDYTNDHGSIAADTTSDAVVKNTKGTELDTGVVLDNAPYIVLMVVAVLGMGVMLTKKRAY